jgi:hypothetical protein
MFVFNCRYHFYKHNASIENQKFTGFNKFQTVEIKPQMCKFTSTE